MYEITSRNLAAQPTAVVEATVPVTEISTWLPGVYAEVFEHLRRLGIAPAGPPFARYLLLPEVFEVEAGLPVPESLPDTEPGAGRVRRGSLPGGPVAVTTHIGPYERLGEALAAVDSWIEEHDGEPAGAHWEVYFSDPRHEPDPARWRTDVVRPYRARVAAAG